jgi:hypothetical protein
MTAQDSLVFTLVGLAALALAWRLFRATLGPLAARWLFRHGHYALGRRLLPTSACGQCVHTVPGTIIPHSRAPGLEGPDVRTSRAT